MKLTKTHENIFILLLIFATFFFWQSVILFPFKLLSVIFHEFAHVVGVYCSGGYIISVQITNDLGGITSSKNANELSVLLCGYPGSAIFGVLTYIFAVKQKYVKYYLVAISLIFLSFALFFVKNEFGIISSVIISAFFACLLFIKNQTVLGIILKIIALLNIAYVINDVIYDTYLTTNLYSDAVRLEQLTGVNDWLWGTIWIAIALCSMFFIVRNMLRTKRK
jgi:hypothetical protein